MHGSKLCSSSMFWVLIGIECARERTTDVKSHAMQLAPLRICSPRHSFKWAYLILRDTFDFENPITA